MRISSLVGAVWLCLGVFSALQAQGQFSPAIRINDQIITGFELEQRARLLNILSPTANAPVLAREQLIEDRLKQQVLRQAGISVTQEAVEEGMEQFAARGNLNKAQFLTLIAERGVARETFEDFVAVGLAWREFASQRFRARAIITESEVDRRIALTGQGSALRVLLSEIVLPNVPQVAEESRIRANRLQQITSINAFSAAAREFSFSETRDRGGRLDWRPINSFAPELRQTLLSLKPGEVAPPLELGNALVLLQLRGIEETEVTQSGVTTIDYATYLIGGGDTERSETQAQRVMSEIDTCDDLYSVARGQPEERLQRVVASVTDIPADVAFELSKLDPNEANANILRANGAERLLVMLCSRTTILPEDVDRGQVRNALTNERIGALSENFVEDLLADALIIER